MDGPSRTRRTRFRRMEAGRPRRALAPIRADAALETKGQPLAERSPIVASQIDQPSRVAYAWAVRGDINAFFGLMLDNLGGMILMAGLLVGVYGMPADFVLMRMIPGTAVGVLVGDVIYT